MNSLAYQIAGRLALVAVALLPCEHLVQAACCCVPEKTATDQSIGLAVDGCCGSQVTTCCDEASATSTSLSVAISTSPCPCASTCGPQHSAPSPEWASHSSESQSDGSDYPCPSLPRGTVSIVNILTADAIASPLLRSQRGAERCALLSRFLL